MLVWYEVLLVPLHNSLFENVLDIISSKESHTNLRLLKAYTSSISISLFLALEKVSDSITKFSEPVYHRIFQQDFFNYLRAICSSSVSEKKSNLEMMSFISWIHHQISEEIEFCHTNFIGIDSALLESLLTEIFVEKYKTDITACFIPSLNNNDKTSLSNIFFLLSRINEAKENGIMTLKNMFEVYCLDFAQNYFSNSRPESEHPCLVSHTLVLYNYLIELCWDCFDGRDIFIEIVEKVCLNANITF